MQRPHNTSALNTSQESGANRRQERLLTVVEIADLLQVPVSWVYERTRPHAANRLPHLKIGKYLRFVESAVVDWIETQQVAGRSVASRTSSPYTLNGRRTV
jgi:excisionase family DNA binding protein